MALSDEAIRDLLPVLVDTLDDTDELDRIVFLATGDRLFKHYAAKADTLEEALFKLLTKATARGGEGPVLSALYAARPGRADVRAAIAAALPGAALAAVPPKAELSLQTAGAPAADASTNAYAPGFERIVKPGLAPFDVRVWLSELERAQARVCRVEIGGAAAGTGFLVGPRAVLTNWHVVEKADAAKITCRFDYVTLPAGGRSEGRMSAVAAIADHSPYSPAEARNRPDEAPPTADELDYALLELAEPAGDDPLETGTRGFVRLPEVDQPAPVGAPLLIVQHPDGAPMKLAIDTEAILGPAGDGRRLRYATNTEGGSSGSPCFSMDWQILALHHYGDPAWQHPLFNQGVPIALVTRRLIAKGQGGLIDR